MTQSKTDPRIERTRRWILDAFIELSAQKEFKDITVKDITNEAKINRTTFYYHFEDIYDLLDKALSEVLFIELNKEDYQHNELNEESCVQIFKAITNFQRSLSNRCHRGYEDIIAKIIREQLEIIFYCLLVKQQQTVEEKDLRTTAAMFTWGIYGASVEWGKSGQHIGPEAFIQPVLACITRALGSKKE
ncbi:TetR/AcrR family transcriptional regulator [Gracilibacillus timonensis]|uniref:TetR/AcrR family transcriptional regulator n=1 Tax=Gracilibacillus timonensis TaxID=1816696 RepID=UPI0008254007|nr:TetR/AcrR family transcriptional regulator [Gracilibacillus timonensis]